MGGVTADQNLQKLKVRLRSTHVTPVTQKSPCSLPKNNPTNPRPNYYPITVDPIFRRTAPFTNGVGSIMPKRVIYSI